MALILKDIYEDSKNRFQLELIAGAAGLDRVMKWVYVAEDYSTADFLHGGELIITTGVISQGSSEWLMRFLHHMTAQHTCGLIINEGQYLHKDDISQNVLDFCDRNQFPLFLMPWWIHIYDITRDYYDRIFIDTRRDEAINQAFLNLIDPKERHETALSCLSDYHFPENAPYYAAAFDVSQANDMALSDNSRLMNQIFSMVAGCSFPCYLVTKNDCFFLICQQEKHPPVEAVVNQLREQIHEYYPARSVSAGIGGRAEALSGLCRSYQQAQAALQMGRHKGLTLFRYEDMGFFKLLLEISDEALLRGYVEAQLGPVHQYDQKHKSDFSQTLYRYLTCDRSIQAVAQASFCHRNTINHRLQIMKNTMGYRLDDTMACFELMTAFLVEDYLRFREG